MKKIKITRKRDRTYSVMVDGKELADMAVNFVVTGATNHGNANRVTLELIGDVEIVDESREPE